MYSYTCETDFYGGGAGCEPVTVMMTARLQESKRFGNIIKGALADMKDLFSS